MRSIVTVLVVGSILALSRPSEACPTNDFDCGGFCCPNGTFCCPGAGADGGGACGVTSNCGNPPDAGSPPVTCLVSQAEIVANCGNDTCACADACNKNIDCPSNCCSRGRCTNACVCGNTQFAWTLCGPSTGGNQGQSSGCTVGSTSLADSGWFLGLFLAIGTVARSVRRLTARRLDGN